MGLGWGANDVIEDHWKFGQSAALVCPSTVLVRNNIWPWSINPADTVAQPGPYSPANVLRHRLQRCECVHWAAVGQWNQNGGNPVGCDLVPARM